MTKSPSKTLRETMLEEVAALTTGERNSDYGEPFDNMDRTAKMMSAYLSGRQGSSLSAADVAAFGIILKLGRLAHKRHSLDSWRDIAGYAAIGFEVVQDAPAEWKSAFLKGPTSD
ncbi:MAG: DUF6378 domain-containing protein [Pseudomonadales bacterium]